MDGFEKGALTVMAIVAVALCMWHWNGVLDQREIDQQAASCAHHMQTWTGNMLCYESDWCLVTADNYVTQVRTHDYIEENCPDEWEAIKGPTQAAPTQEANPGNGVGPESRADRGGREEDLFPTT